MAGERTALAVDGGPAVRSRPLPTAKGVAYIGEEEKQAVLEVLESRSLFRYYGPHLLNKVREFEEQFAAYAGVRYAVGVSSGTAALRAGLAALGTGPGDEVIVPAVTFIATVAAVVAQRAVPVFAEVDDSLNMDPADMAAKITPRTRAVVPVHLGNVPCDMDAIMAVARDRGVGVLEDAAQAAGASYRGRRVGSIGDLGAFSLQLEKNITSGEGGVVTTNDWPLYDRAARFQDQGGQFTTQSGTTRGETSGEPFLGENLRMTEIAGAIAAVQLRRLDGMLASLRANKRRVKQQAADLPGVTFRRIPDPDGEGASHLIFFVRDSGLASRVVTALRAEGIPAGQFYNGRPVYLNPAVLNQATVVDWGCPFQCPAYPTDVRYYEGLCPRTEDLLARHVAIGIGPAWSEADCDDVATALRKVARHLLS